MRPEVKGYHLISKQKISLMLANNLNTSGPIHKELKIEISLVNGPKLSCRHFKTSAVWSREGLLPSNHNTFHTE